MKNYIILTATMLLLVGFTNTKSVVKTNVKSQSRGELKESMNNNENVAALSCCGTCGSCDSCPCPCRPQPDCTSSCIAIKAAQEARAAAAAQQMAAAQASHIVKAQLAEKAIQAARAAEAALAGKLFHVNQLEHEVCETRAVVIEEANSCRKTQYNLQIAMTAAEYAFLLLKTLLWALKICENTVYYSQETAQGLTEELAEKLALLEAAKCRLEALLRELYVAKQDLAAISQAACRARAAARCACSCVQRCKRLTSSNERDDGGLYNFFSRILESGQEVKQLIQSITKE